MLKSIAVRGFKSLVDVGPIEMAPLTLFFGPNTAGKSNLIDAIVLLSRLATARTVAEAFEGPVRGQPLEFFTFEEVLGLSGLLSKSKATFELDSELTAPGRHYRYRVVPSIAPKSGAVTIDDEYLARLTKAGKIRGAPAIQRHDGVIRIRRRARAHPWEEPVGLNHAVISNSRYSGGEYVAIEEARAILSSFRSYYLDPRTAMRESRSPREVNDIGTLGENIAPFLYRLHVEKPKAFRAIRRTLCTLISSVNDLVIDLDKKRGFINLEIRQDKTPFSARIVSEGTLRVLALLCVAMNPWGGSLVAFEEPENGVHPRRVELIAKIFGSLALQGEKSQQVLLTTHSPLLCSAVLRFARSCPGMVRVYQTLRNGAETRFQLFEPLGPLFDDVEVKEGLMAPDEDRIFEGLILRGLLDG